ncbi:MAG: hypothetical protein QOG79_4460 [Mycobacterium sp.]|jgi:hypothetical protein|nr:hypothetical protein [Mycobacterium sp.]MDT5193892.1 hypothetical protein [Mycobacterium sp.]MDT5241827.1 hypothetical protein [Mycobacterium sp.]MDT5266580.1 hypothetical protein [Mycobacterium sp.]MDT5288970.1 hypothetical protein [Mycobacterium sp.]
MKKLALGIATAGTLAAMTIGLASPAMAAPRNVSPNYDAVYVTDQQNATYQQVDCSVSVNHQGTNVNVRWC